MRPSRVRSQRSIAPRFRFFDTDPLEEAVERLASGGIEERGAIFTRREVVEFILDLVGYTVDRPLATFRLLEPSFGNGDFLFAAVDRLLASYRASGSNSDPLASLPNALVAVELHWETYQTSRSQLLILLQSHGIPATTARILADAWLKQGDFLLADIEGGFSHVVGNPPYVRQELIPDALVGEYRARFSTIYDRADLYVPFIERSMQLLRPKGALGFICADRWMKNRYGGPLRRLVAERHHLRAYIDMVDTPAFHSDVIAYPAIFVIGNEQGNITRLAYRPAIDSQSLAALARAMRDGEAHEAITEVAGIAAGAEPWIVDAANQLAVVRRLEAEFPLIEVAGCKVGIGVATGADRVFIAKFDELDVEPERKLPLAMSRDINSGVVKWRGYGVLNPFEDDGRLASFAAYPKFARYLEKHGAMIKQRHVSQKNPGNWYRTIDRIYPSLTWKPKLLFPDIKGEANVVYEAGQLYPHHNLYFLTSDSWDLHALQAVMLSAVARLFVATYSTKMRGGYLRFQAQYVRRIRLPEWCDVSSALRNELKAAAQTRDVDRCNATVRKLYKLSPAECQAIGMNGAE